MVEIHAVDPRDEREWHEDDADDGEHAHNFIQAIACGVEIKIEQVLCAVLLELDEVEQRADFVLEFAQSSESCAEMSFLVLAHRERRLQIRKCLA
jgi:hypothetical protein